MKKLIAVIFTLLICLSAFGQGTKQTENSTKQKILTPVERLEKVLEETVKRDEPGVAVVVIKDGEIKYKRTRGIADLSAKTPITAKTPFYIASIGKQFTAVAIMMLEERGGLSYDDKLVKTFLNLNHSRQT